MCMLYMLTNYQLEELCEKMDVPLEAIVFKDRLKDLGEVKYNKSYIVNLHDEFQEDGHRNEGSHWVCFQINKYASGKTAGIYFDSYATGPPTDIADFVGEELPHNQKDIQSLMNNACGWYCCAFLHYINAYPERTGHLYADTENFLSIFVDLDKSCDFKYNEFALKHFFRSAEEDLRKPIDVDGVILNADTITK